VKSLRLTVDQWKIIHKKIKESHAPSVWLSREKMRRVLGFTPREHIEWLGYYDTASSSERLIGKHGYKTTVHLDFFNESQKTIFLLKYGEWI
jgi:hypothetical protein